LPSALRATPVTVLACWNVWSLAPLAASHRIAVLSLDPVRTCLPLALRARFQTSLACPLKVWRFLAAGRLKQDRGLVA